MKTFTTSYGVITVCNKDEQNILSLSKGHIPDHDFYEKFLNEYLLKSSTVIDVGAGIGARDILFTKINPSISIYSFEPREEYFYLLTKNTQVNNVENIIALNNMLGNLVGPLNVRMDSNVYDHDDIIEMGFGSLMNEQKTYHLVTLDSLHLLTCNMIFVDLEEFVYPCLMGAVRTIKQMKPIICFRNSKMKAEPNKGDLPKIKDFLARLDYRFLDEACYTLAIPIADMSSSQCTEVQGLVDFSNNLITNVK